MKARILAPLGVTLGVALLTGCATHATQPGSASSESVPVRVAAVRTHALAATINLSGSLSAVRSVTVGAASPGRVVAVDVRVGDRVTAGQEIAQVDAAQYRAQYAQAQAGLSVATDGARAARARLDAARSAYHLANITTTRMERLYAQGAISQQRLNEVQANLAAAQAGVAQAQAGIQAASSMGSQAQAGVDVAAVPLQNASIVAPFSGVITQKFVQPGAVVGPGSPVAALEDPARLEIDVAVPDRDAASLTLGSRVRVSVDSAHNAMFFGHVQAIVPSRNPALRSAMVKIAVPSASGLISGMFARVQILGASHRVVAVPFAAIATRADQTGVFLVSGSAARFVPVRTGSIHGDLITIRRNVHLPIGARVAISGVARLTDGASVQVSP